MLTRLGHEAFVVQERPSELSIPKGFISLILYAKRALMKLLELSDIPIHAERVLMEQRPLVSFYTNRFIEENIHYSEIHNFHDLKPTDYNAYIVGSDQVWRPAYNDLYNTFLQFTDNWNVKRVAYAASFGTDKKEYTEEQINSCKALVRNFDAVSVREKSGVELCSDYFGIKANYVLDPTLLLNKEDYISLANIGTEVNCEGKLFVYILDSSEEKRELVAETERLMNLTSFSVKAKNDYKYAPLADRVQPPVELWIRGIMESEYVITDSFHGCAFSILFNKPFIVLGNAERGMARFNSLLSQFCLMDRLILTKADLNNILQKSINWNNVNYILYQSRMSSLNFLRDSLS